MRIAIDARKLHDYGIGTYVRNLVRALARQDDDDTYVLLCRDADVDVRRGRSGRASSRSSRAPANYSRARADQRAAGAARARASICSTRRTTSSRR